MQDHHHHIMFQYTKNNSDFQTQQQQFQLTSPANQKGRNIVHTTLLPQGTCIDRKWHMSWRCNELLLGGGLVSIRMTM